MLWVNKKKPRAVEKEGKKHGSLGEHRPFYMKYVVEEPELIESIDFYSSLKFELENEKWLPNEKSYLILRLVQKASNAERRLALAEARLKEQEKRNDKLMRILNSQEDTFMSEFFTFEEDK